MYSLLLIAVSCVVPYTCASGITGYAGRYGGSYGGLVNHGLGGYSGYGVVPTVVTGPQIHAVITGPQTNAVITGPVATAQIRGSQSHTVLAAPAAVNVAVGHGILNQGLGYAYGPGHVGVVGSGYRYGGALGDGAIIVSNGNGYVSAGHQGAIIKGPRNVPALIDRPSGKIHAEGFWGPTTRGLQSYGHGW